MLADATPSAAAKEPDATEAGEEAGSLRRTPGSGGGLAVRANVTLALSANFSNAPKLTGKTTGGNCHLFGDKDGKVAPVSQSGVAALIATVASFCDDNPNCARPPLVVLACCESQHVVAALRKIEEDRREIVNAHVAAFAGKHPSDYLVHTALLLAGNRCDGASFCAEHNRQLPRLIAVDHDFGSTLSVEEVGSHAWHPRPTNGACRVKVDTTDQ